ncbi:MAG: GNAT family N-acetyltransferase, partial [Chloroflexota bacterium]|nr:GNAT family N-acetyltransferase [Chloroflexota bacterium]
RQQWKPEDWHLVLGVWAGEQPIGTQAVSAKAFAANRAVTSGSWLGQAFQGKGYGTEMRAAVLELAFHGLGAERAESAWLDGSHASRRVSEKLGYRVVGRGTVSPRGRPTGETKVEIRREDWLSPFDVVIANLEPALPLFGIDA